MKLSEMKLFDNIEEITMTQFRQSPGEYVTQAQMGKTFVITKNGDPVVILAKVEPSAAELGAEARRIGIA